MISGLAIEKLDSLMDWFVNLEASKQQNFIRNMILDKFDIKELKHDETVSLLSCKN